MSWQQRQLILLNALNRKTRSIACVRCFQTSAVKADGVERGFRSPGWWVPDHQPDKFPGDDKELRRKAALKYGLLPQDYKPDKDDGTGWGNYPDLGEFTYDHKDPYENWSNNFYRRNWGEPAHKDWDRFRPDRITYTGLDDREEAKWWVPRAILIYSTFALIIYSFTLSYDNTNAMLTVPYMPKQMPYDFKRAWPYEDPRNYPITNYTFESASQPDHDHAHH